MGSQNMSKEIPKTTMSTNSQLKLPQIERKFGGILNVTGVTKRLVLAFIVNYVYMMYVRLDDKILFQEIKTLNSVSRDSGNIVLTSREPESIFRISKRFARRHNLSDIIINGKIVNINDEKQMFYYVINNNELVVKSNYALQPSASDMLLRFGDQEIKLTLNMGYKLGALSRPDLLASWSINPQGNVEQTTDRVIIHPPSIGKVTTFRYRKRFLDNVKLTSLIVPDSTPINLSIFIGQYSSVFIGLYDDRTIHVVQSKGKSSNAINDTAIREYFKIVPNQEYRITLEKNNRNYRFNVEGNGGNKVIEFAEDDSCLSSTEKFKNVGFGVWPGSAGVSVKDVVISSSDRL